MFKPQRLAGLEEECEQERRVCCYVPVHCGTELVGYSSVAG
jgi:hypothetical protein